AKRLEDSGDGPFKSFPRPESAILCGDFNMKPDDPLHDKIGLVDAWKALNPGKPHPATFRVHEAGETPYCCDYVFVTPDLAPRLRAIRVDGATQASDHQPVIVELA
ncbi:MAG TPA: endonuclease/exonuclease/phosphatase family protein, partial [Burkholderiales bacterium]|nr:endonuclease/exonuclease/phosphatase family protein [Burkholderiales bacterium]